MPWSFPMYPYTYPCKSMSFDVIKQPLFFFKFSQSYLFLYTAILINLFLLWFISSSNREVPKASCSALFFFFLSILIIFQKWIYASEHNWILTGKSKILTLVWCPIGTTSVLLNAFIIHFLSLVIGNNHFTKHQLF